MARTKTAKAKFFPPSVPQTLNAQNMTVKNPGVGKYVTHQGLLGYGQVAFGDKQGISTAPLAVPPGFATQVPYNSAINSTIIQNSSAIPITTFYSAMISDPIVYSSILYMVTTIISRIGDHINTNPENQKIVRDAIHRIGKIKLFQGLLTSVWSGIAAIKLNWDYIDGYTTIKNILVLPPDSIMLAVTPEGELDEEFGLMQYYYNINSEWNQNQKAFSSYGNAPLAAFSSYMSPQRQVAFNPMFLSAIPKDYRIIHTFNPIGLAGNWWGTSLIQSIFSNIVDKNNLKFKIQVAATFKAAPMVVYGTDTQTQVQVNDNGDTISMAQNIQNTVAEAAATGYQIIEGMEAYKVDTIDNTANLDEMRNLLNHYNSEIRAGLCTPDLVGNSGSYANAMANNQANEEIINNLTLQVIHTVQSQLVETILDMAVYGDKNQGIPVSEREYGYFELLDNSLNDKAIWAKIIESAKEIGMIDPKSIEDFNFIRKKLGLAPITELNEDLVYGMMGLVNEGEHVSKSNIAKTKEQIREPYANGMDKTQNNRYGMDYV